MAKANTSENDESKKTTLHVGKATPEQIKAWKLEHKDDSEEEGIIQELKVKVGPNEFSYGYLREPDRDELSRALTLLKNKSSLDSGSFLMQNCFIGGDPRLKTVKRLNVTASIQANGCFEMLESDAKKY